MTDRTPSKRPSRRSRVVRGGALLVGGHAGARLFSLVRLAILARVLGPQEFGLASILILTLLMIEMASNLSFDKALIRSDDTGSRTLLPCAHALNALRGLLCAALLIAVSGPVSALLGEPGAAPLLRWLAIAPLIAGFSHLEPKRVQRELRYAPDVCVELGAQLFVTLAAWPIAIALGDASAAVWLLVGRSASLAIGSHIAARTPYRWSLDGAQIRHLFAFGAPLIANGLLLFSILQGDQFVVGSRYGLASLGVYAAVFALISAPALLLAKISISLFLPLYSQDRGSAAAFAATHARLSHTLGLLAIALTGGFVAIGSAIVPAIYGQGYEVGRWLLVSIAVMIGVRVLRVAPTIASISKGDTANAMQANFVRILALPAAIAFASAGAPLTAVAICGAIGEAGALIWTLGRLSTKSRVSISPDRSVALAFAIATIAVVIAAATLGDAAAHAAPIAAWCVGLIACVLASPVLRRESLTALAHLHGPNGKGVTA